MSAAGPCVEELQRRLQLTEAFIAILSHDLRNPLCAILAAVRVLATESDPRVRALNLEAIRDSATRMIRMIEQLLHFTRTRLGNGIPIVRTCGDLRPVLGHIVDELRGTYQREIRLECDGELSGDWDVDRLSEVLSNLGANACRYGNPGEPVVVHADGTSGDCVCIEVCNGGVIPEEQRGTLFEPFAAAVERNGDGLGLGLYITRQIVLAHGGTIGVQSDRAAGTRFRFTLPRRRSGSGEVMLGGIVKPS